MARAVVLDTSVFIYWLEGNSEFGPYALEVMRKIEDGQIQGLASELVLGELLIRPMKLGLSEIVEGYIKDLPEFPNLEFRAVDRERAEGVGNSLFGGLGCEKRVFNYELLITNYENGGWLVDWCCG